ncbi:MAG: GGDEF domain-containing protein [Nitrospira sp.]|nr:GGDEF domain-containing protein [Nitrospira sp.]
MAWIEATPADSGSLTEVLSVRLLVGWLGLFVAAGCAVVGLLSWPSSQDPTRRKHDGVPSAYDGVTGLPTRRLFLILLKQALSRAETIKRHVAVLVCSLEQFRPLSTASAAPNMTLVVRVQAARIKSALQSHDVVARLDEYLFAVVVDNLASPDEARVCAEKIQSAIALPLLVEGQELLMSCRIGGVVGPQQGRTAESLLDVASDVLENNRSHEERRILIMAVPQPCLGASEVRSFPPASDRHEASLTSRS